MAANSRFHRMAGCAVHAVKLKALAAHGKGVKMKTEIVKWLLGIAISAFLAGIAVLQFLDTRIEGKLNPLQSRVETLEQQLSSKQVEIDELSKKLRELSEGEKSAVRFTDSIALRTVVANRYVGAVSGKGPLDANRDWSRPDEAFIIEKGNPKN